MQGYYGVFYPQHVVYVHAECPSFLSPQTACTNNRAVVTVLSGHTNGNIGFDGSVLHIVKSVKLVTFLCRFELDPLIKRNSSWNDSRSTFKIVLH